MKKTDLLNEDIVVINLGLDNFVSSLKDQGSEVIEINWSPPAENDRLAALSLANIRKAHWYIAGDSLNSALPNAYWANPGLMSLTNRYCKIRSTL